jgi:hypothetical protein
MFVTMHWKIERIMNICDEILFCLFNLLTYERMYQEDFVDKLVMKSHCPTFAQRELVLSLYLFGQMASLWARLKGPARPGHSRPTDGGSLKSCSNHSTTNLTKFKGAVVL